MGSGASVTQGAILRNYRVFLAKEGSHALSVAGLSKTLGWDDKVSAEMFSQYVGIHFGGGSSKKRLTKAQLDAGISWKEWAMAYGVANTKFNRKLFTQMSSRGVEEGKETALDCRDVMLGLFKLCTATTLVTCRQIFTLYDDGEGRLSKQVIKTMLADMHSLDPSDPKIKALLTALCKKLPEKGNEGATLPQWIKALQGEGALKPLQPVFVLINLLKERSMGVDWWAFQTNQLDLFLKLRDKMDVDELLLVPLGDDNSVGSINEYLKNKKGTGGGASGSGGVTGEDDEGERGDKASVTDSIGSEEWNAMSAEEKRKGWGMRGGKRRRRKGEEHENWRNGGETYDPEMLCLNPVKPTEHEERVCELLAQCRERSLQLRAKYDMRRIT